MSLPTLADGRPPPGKSQPPNVGKEILDAVRTEVANLQSEDRGVVARAAATLFVLATRKEAAPHLAAAVPQLVVLLSDSDIYCQRNACGALTAIMNSSEALYSAVCSCYGLGPALAEALMHEDRATRLNAGAALGALAQGMEGLDAITAAQADEALLANLRSDPDDQVVEASADAVCAMAAHEFQRASLVAKGAVEALAGLLQRPSPEVQIRALLGLGMFTGSSEEGQVRLAAAEGSIPALLILTRSEDKDIKGIASDVFSGLAGNRALRPLLEEQLRLRADAGQHAKTSPAA